ncbi:hypothetical protein [Flavobacterium sp. H122]|uniref:hypothetical protein n=1 Tax=Flavobacterium sp. H122 TaxID=2529860 RepID=UPI0010AA27DD|nr:hypothetical protein [Flavobacterium sp. H122]
MKKIFLFALLATLSCRKEETADYAKVHKPKDTIQKTEEKKVTLDFPEAYGFLEKLIKEDIDGQEYDDLQIKKIPFSVHYPNDGDSYTVSFSIVQKSDFNKDGITDYIVKRNSEGMLGGNVNTNQSLIFYIMGDKTNSKEEHTIYGYAPFSYNVIDSTYCKNNRFVADIIQNYRVYDTEDLQSATVSFVYKNNNIYEESYLTDCKLAQLKSKTIFKTVPNISNRKRTIDGHNYTEIISETYKNKDTLITADLTGCDNLLLTFETSYNVQEQQMDNEDFKKTTALQLLDFLSLNTLFSKDISAVKNYFNENPMTNEYIKNHKGYNFRILIDKNEGRKNQLRFLVNIDKINNENQIENWEIVTRKKR